MCESEGVESNVVVKDVGHSVITENSGYVDVNGIYVPHKKNEMFFTQYKCSKGHIFTSSSKPHDQEV